MQDEFFMRLALQQAQQAQQRGEVPVGAVLVSGGDVLAAGFNQPVSTSDPSAHAEVVALRRAGQILGNYRLVDTTLYVTLEPCLMCVGALVLARVARVVYGAKEPKTGALESLLDVRTLASNHRFEVTAGVLADECGRLLTTFFAERRNS